MAQCRECGRDFIENRPFQVFCDSRCKGAYHRRKYREQAREQAVQRQLNSAPEFEGGSLAEKVKEALANIKIDIPADAIANDAKVMAKHKCKGCGRSTTNPRFCSARCRMKFFSSYQDAEADNGRKFVRRI